MILAKIVGKVVPATCHSGLNGVRILLADVLDNQGQPSGRIVGTADWLGAGSGDIVMVNADGDAVGRRISDPDTPLRNIVMGIVDPETGELAS